MPRPASAAQPEVAVQSARSWVEHLRGGGTTPWAAWPTREPGPGDRPVPAPDHRTVLPGAQQLELLRRVNLAATAGSSVPAGLADRVLHARTTGRGPLEADLLGTAPGRRWGTPPVDPAALPARELLRVAVGLLADDLAATPVPAEPVPPRRPHPPWRRNYRLVGDPGLADPLRAQLLADGRRPGRAGALVVVVGGPVERMLADAWVERSLQAAAPRWTRFLELLRRRGALPGPADVAGTTRHWVEQVGRGRVVTVLDPAEVGPLLGGRRASRRPLAPPPPPLPAAAGELLRLVSRTTGLLVGDDDRQALLRGVLLPRLRAAAVGLPAPGVPSSYDAWLAAQVDDQRTRLRRYPLRGHLDVLAERTAGGAVPDDDDALALAVGLLLDAAGVPGTRGGRST